MTRQFPRLAAPVSLFRKKSNNTKYRFYKTTRVFYRFFVLSGGEANAEKIIDKHTNIRANIEIPTACAHHVESIIEANKS